jgi:potassium efflux system protein
LPDKDCSEADRSMAHRKSRISLSTLLPLAVLACFGSAQAQFQLAPPAIHADGWGAQVAQTDTLQTPPQAAAPPPAEPPKAAAPPDFSIVDRATGMNVAPAMEAWAKTLDELDQTLNGPTLPYSQLDKVRDGLEAVRHEIDQFTDALTPKLDAAKAQVDNLGAAPATGEPEAVASQRAELQKAFGSLSAARNIAESTRLRTAQITSRVQDIRRKKFASRLFERVPDAHDSNTWINAPSQLSYAVQKAGQTVAGWWNHTDRRPEIVQLLVLAIVLAAATFYASHRGIRHFRSWDEPAEPPIWRRATSAAWVILLRVLPYAATSAFLYYGMNAQGLMPDDIDRLAYSAMRSTLIIAAVASLVTTALAPRSPHWRLLPMSNEAADRIRWLVVALASVYSLTLLLATIRYVANAPFTLSIAQNCVSAIIVAGLVIAILRTSRNAPSVAGAPEFAWISKLRMPLWGIAGLILATALTGYIGLARFISAQLIVTGTTLAVLYLLLIWVDAFGLSLGDEEAKPGRWLKEQAGFDQRRREQLALPVTLLLKSAVLLCTLPFILLQWGFDWQDIGEWGSALFFGFKIGNTQISVAAILASAIVFGLGYLVARLFQNWLDDRILAPAGISGGARHSIRTGVGYLGIIVAALFAVSYAGLDLSNIALIAGALSVGIGLGLQGVVNNFVSGIILLVERPIKVGDWVVVGGEEGLVRKISVRSTEIETFDRANVLVPNSYFISEKVKNWTLHNYSGRIIIPVSVQYGSNPRQVRDVLLRVAKAHPQVMTNPEPSVYFEDFASDALNFKLFAYAYDITKSLALRTDLRIGIIEAFCEEGINIRGQQSGEQQPAVAQVAQQARPEPRQRASSAERSQVGRLWEEPRRSNPE